MVVVFLVPGGAFGWGGVEHKVIAYIAWENLSPEARSAVVKLMMQSPPDSGVQTLLSAGSSTDPRRFFIAASVWPDLVKIPTREDRKTKYSCPLWHFAEFTFAEPGVEVPDLPGFKPRQVNVMERLQFFQNALVDEDEPIGNRAIELVWTIHLVGDVHQPLHIASRVTKLEPESDLGGNRFRIGRQSLHGYWDTILTHHYDRSNSSEDVYIKYLANLLTEKYPRAKLDENLARLKPEEWANESFELARSVAYSGVTRGSEPSAEYDRRALNEGELRIALAGYRLAQMLNRLFGPGSLQTASKPAMTKDTKKIKARLDYDLACVASTLDDKTRELMVVKGTTLGGQTEGQQVVGFDSDKVKGIVNETREALLETLAGEELAGLRAYVIKQFPDPSQLQTFRTTGGPNAFLRPGKANSVSIRKTNFSYYSPLSEVNISLVQPVNNLIGQVKALIFGVRRSGPISLQVITHPQTGANIVLLAPGGKRYATSTNSHINDFWPGTYNFTVTRDGSITISHSSVDLGFGSSVIDCPLVNSGTPVLCQFR